MLIEKKRFARFAIIITSMVVLGVVFVSRALHNLTSIDFRNSNFFFFWLAGRMAWLGQNPYDSVQWLAGHDAYGATMRPNQIFLYPLPLAFFLEPFGLLPLPVAYLVWHLISQLLIALTVWLLLTRMTSQPRGILFLPWSIFLLFFGPVFLTLQIGALGAFTLFLLLLAIISWQHRHNFLAGIVLSLTFLKPPQGATILLLAGIWLVARRDWKGIGAILLGMLGMFILGEVADPLWLIKFLGASQVAMDRTIGVQSNALGFAFLACQRSIPCMWRLGGSIMLIGLISGGYILWRNQSWLTPWQAFSIILPLAFFSNIYLWSYDQIVYIIPIVLISCVWVDRTRSYVPSFVFMVILVLVSMIALTVQAHTHSDMLSILTTILVVSNLAWLIRPPSIGSRGRIS